ncbi:MAG: hypothetical protein WC758_05280 [Candidatus Woesearchaeota archaeon]|jgi:hypothetical protein
MGKDYFASPEEILLRKDDLFSQDRYFAEDLRNFSTFLEKKKTNQDIDLDYNDLEGINGLTDILRQAEEGLNYNCDTATEKEKSVYLIIHGKAYEKMKLLAKNTDNKANIKLVVSDLSALVENVRSQNIVHVQILNFYINLISAFEKVVDPDNTWYDKSIIVG